MAQPGNKIVLEAVMRGPNMREATPKNPLGWPKVQVVDHFVGESEFEPVGGA